MAKVGSRSVVPNTCGLQCWSVFRSDDYYYGEKIKTAKPLDGTGFAIAGFTDEDPAYIQAYLELRAKYKLEYQSPVRVNTRTGNKFFFCIFDTRNKP